MGLAPPASCLAANSCSAVRTLPEAFCLPGPERLSAQRGPSIVALWSLAQAWVSLSFCIVSSSGMGRGTSMSMCPGDSPSGRVYPKPLRELPDGTPILEPT